MPSKRQQQRREAQAKQLDADIKRVLAIRRALLADLAESEDRLRRLEIDVRRLLCLSGHQQQLEDRRGSNKNTAKEKEMGGKWEKKKTNNRIVFSPISTALAEQKRFLSTFRTGTGDLAREDILRAFRGAVGFARDVRAVVPRCEACVGRWDVCLARGRACWGDLCAALEGFSSSSSCELEGS